MKRHPFDSFSFIMGLMTIAIGSAFLFGPNDGTMALSWLWPTFLLGLGLAVISMGIQRALRSSKQ